MCISVCFVHARVSSPAHAHTHSYVGVKFLVSRGNAPHLKLSTSPENDPGFVAEEGCAVPLKLEPLTCGELKFKVIMLGINYYYNYQDNTYTQRRVSGARIVFQDISSLRSYEFSDSWKWDLQILIFVLPRRNSPFFLGL